MKLAKALDEKLMDVRIVDRLMAQGKISKDDVDKNLANLPDEQGNFEHVGSDDKSQSTPE